MAECLIVYYSYHHGNTKMLAGEMAAAVGADLCTVEKLNGINLANYKIIGFGSGIAFGKHYKQLLDAANTIDISKKDVFVFSTSGTGSEKQNKFLVELLEKKGANLIGNFACKGFDTYGPFKLIGGVSVGHPNDEDFEASRQFIRGIVQKSAN